MFDGAFLKTPYFRQEKNERDSSTEFAFGFLCGIVTADPKIAYAEFDSTENATTVQRVTVNVCYMRPKGYFNIVSWGNTQMTAMARALRKDDIVFCVGTIKKSRYMAKKGVKKGEMCEWTELRPTFLVAQSWIDAGFAIANSPGIGRIVASDEADAMESLDDHAEDEYVEEDTGYDEYVPDL